MVLGADSRDAIARTVGVGTREGSSEDGSGVGGQCSNAGITESSSCLELDDSGNSAEGEVSVSRDEDVGTIEVRDATHSARSGAGTSGR